MAAQEVRAGELPTSRELDLVEHELDEAVTEMRDTEDSALILAE
jgi:hypothetical protein